MVNITGAFEAEALRILRGIPGLSVSSVPAIRTRGIDAVLRFAGSRAPFAVEMKHRADAATAWQLVQRAETHPDARFLLIAGQTTAKAREILTEHGVAIVDGLGNAHIALPGLLFHLEGRRTARGDGPTFAPARLRGKAGTLAQALLLHPGRTWQVTSLAEEAQVSAALAHRVLARLQEQGILVAQGTGPNRVRRVTDPTALLDLWAEENVDRPARTLAHLLAQTPQRLVKDLGGRLGRGNIGYALTGAAAASMVAPFVTALPVAEVWVQATAAPAQLLDAVEAKPVADGQNVVFLQAKDDAPMVFREKVDGLWIVNRFRLYVDFRRDPRRGREQADHLRREVIGF